MFATVTHLSVPLSAFEIWQPQNPIHAVEHFLKSFSLHAGTQNILWKPKNRNLYHPRKHQKKVKCSVLSGLCEPNDVWVSVGLWELWTYHQSKQRLLQLLRCQIEAGVGAVGIQNVMCEASGLRWKGVACVLSGRQKNYLNKNPSKIASKCLHGVVLQVLGQTWSNRRIADQGISLVSSWTDTALLARLFPSRAAVSGQKVYFSWNIPRRVRFKVTAVRFQLHCATAGFSRRRTSHPKPRHFACWALSRSQTSACWNLLLQFFTACSQVALS